MKEITSQQYLEYVDLCQPDVVVQLTENIKTQGRGSSKRSVDKAKNFLSHLTTSLKSGEGMDQEGSPMIFASFQGGNKTDLREEAIKNLNEATGYDGIVYHGLFQGETFDQRQVGLISKTQKLFYLKRKFTRQQRRICRTRTSQEFSAGSVSR